LGDLHWDVSWQADWVQTSMLSCSLQACTLAHACEQSLHLNPTLLSTYRLCFHLYVTLVRFQLLTFAASRTWKLICLFKPCAMDFPWRAISTDDKLHDDWYVDQSTIKIKVECKGYQTIKLPNTQQCSK
jgi:hypothetical protein